MFKASTLFLSLLLAGCAGGPAFVKPDTPAPQDWSQWRSGDASLHAPASSQAAWPQPWWTLLHDPVLDDLQRRAVAASPDLRTAALHFAQARVQRGVTSAQAGLQVKGSGGVTRQRQSENGASTRMIDVLGGAVGGGANKDQLVSLLSEPFTLYQAGFDASWELDFWGRVSHAIEAADADVATQAALLDQARMTLASDVARHYLDLRTAQRQQRVVQQDIAAQQERLSLLKAQADAGAIASLDLERQRSDLEASQAQLPPLLAQQAASAGQIELLLGEHPGGLNEALARPDPEITVDALPELSLGLPSEVAQRRPDIRAAEARLRAATANIGVAQADLYPSIKLGGHLGLESISAGDFGKWGSRTWTIGPSLDLPIFDHGRRLRVVQLRELQQQEAAVAYQRTVMQAWHEVDDALNGYTAERQQRASLKARDASNRESLALALARYKGGAVDYTAVLDGQRGVFQAQRDLAASEGRLLQRFAALNNAIAAATDGANMQKQSAE